MRTLPPRATAIWSLIGLVLLTINLRAAITGIAPVLSDLRDVFGLSGAEVGVLTTLPVLCLGVFASVAPIVARRFGTETAIAGSLIMITLGILLRVVQSPLPLYAGTVMAGAGIAMGNVLMPAVIKRAFPTRVGSLTGLAMMLMASSGAIAAGLAVPLDEAGGWRLALAVWAVPSVIALLVWAPLAVRGHRPEGHAASAAQGTLRDNGVPSDRTAPKGRPAGPDEAVSPSRPGPLPLKGPGHRRVRAGVAAASTGRTGSAARLTGCAARERVVPAENSSGAMERSAGSEQSTTSLLRSPVAWYVAAFMGLASLMFYVLISWLPEIMQDAGFAPAAGGMMVSTMMIVGIPLGFLVPVFAARLRDQRPLVVAVAATMVVGLAGLMLAPSIGWVWVLVVGVGTGSAFPLAYTLLSLRAPSPAIAAGLSGMAQTGGYLLAGVGPLAVGVLHGATGGWDVPLSLLLVLVVPEVLFGLLAARPGFVRPAGSRPVSERPARSEELSALEPVRVR